MLLISESYSSESSRPGPRNCSSSDSDSEELSFRGISVQLVRLELDGPGASFGPGRFIFGELGDHAFFKLTTLTSITTHIGMCSRILEFRTQFRANINSIFLSNSIFSKSPNSIFLSNSIYIELDQNIELDQI